MWGCVFSIYPFPLWWLRKYIYTLSYYHHQIGSMNYYPLFKVRSWNNGMRCMPFYILIFLTRYFRFCVIFAPSVKSILFLLAQMSKQTTGSIYGPWIWYILVKHIVFRSVLILVGWCFSIGLHLNCTKCSAYYQCLCFVTSLHHSDRMSAIASQINGNSTVYLTVRSGWQQR